MYIMKRREKSSKFNVSEDIFIFKRHLSNLYCINYSTACAFYTKHQVSVENVTTLRWKSCVYVLVTFLYSFSLGTKSIFLLLNIRNIDICTSNEKKRRWLRWNVIYSTFFLLFLIFYEKYVTFTTFLRMCIYEMMVQGTQSFNSIKVSSSHCLTQKKRIKI